MIVSIFMVKIDLSILALDQKIRRLLEKSPTGRRIPKNIKTDKFLKK